MKTIKVSMLIILEEGNLETKIATKGFQTVQEAIEMLKQYDEPLKLEVTHEE